jgi:hypothetical protein
MGDPQMSALDVTAQQQASWSVTANQLNGALNRVRWITFALAIVGALLAAVASQLDEGTVRKIVAIVAAVSLALGTFLAARLATAKHTEAATRARAASEALKRAAYKFAARAAPYDQPATCEDELNKERSEIETGVDEIIDKRIDADGPGSSPRTLLTADEYKAKRVQGQIDYYLRNATKHQKTARTLRRAEFVLALAATILTAVVAAVGKEAIWKEFDIAALTAVLTTVGATVLAHIEAQRYDYLVTTYRATSRRLQDALASLKAGTAVPSQEWSDFVNRCESIMAAENASWVAKWGGK